MVRKFYLGTIVYLNNFVSTFYEKRMSDHIIYDRLPIITRSSTKYAPTRLNLSIIPKQNCSILFEME